MPLAFAETHAFAARLPLPLRYCLRLGICLLLVAGFSRPALADNLRFRHLLTSDTYEGDSISTSTSIVQDSAGFMWFGGENGLARYDGKDVKVYQAEPQTPGVLSSSYIWDLVIDRTGVLWMATTNGLNRYDPNHDTFYSYTTLEYPDLADNLIRSLAVDEHNNLYIGTAKGLSVLNSDRTVFKNYVNTQSSDSLVQNFVRSVFVDRSNRIWIGTSAHGLERFDPATETFEHFGHIDEPVSVSHNNVSAIAQDHLGRIWIGTYGGGVSLLDEETRTFRRYQHEPEKPNSLSGNTVWDIFSDRDNNLWIATSTGGLSLYRPDTDDFERIVNRPYDAQSILSNSNRSIFQDREGDLWIGSFPSGINYLNRSSTRVENYFHQPDDKTSLSHSGILAFMEDSSGTLWVGTEGGLNAFDPKTGRFTRYLHDDKDPYSLRSDVVLAIEEDYDGSLWIGTWGGGLHRFDKATGRFHNYYPSPQIQGSISSEFIWDILLDSNNDLWIGTEAGGLNRYDRETDRFELFTGPDDTADLSSFNFIWSILEDHNNRLWLGTLSGLAMFNRTEGTFTRYQHQPDNPQSLSSDLVIKVYEDSRGRLWIGTQDQGISIFNPNNGTFHRLTRQHGLPSLAVASFIEDNNGFIWAGTVNGLARIDPNTFEIRSFGRGNGLISSHYNRDASYKDEIGRLYFGGTEGFSIFHPADLETNQDAPTVVITGFSVLNQPVDIGKPGSPLTQAIENTDHIELGHADSTFAFTFAALSYRSPDRNQYEYKLQGFDTRWIPSRGSNTATYTNIDPGTYYFKVRAANSDGVWNAEGTVIKISVLPAPWRTWWAYAGYMLLATLVMLGVVRAKMRQVELEKEKRVNAKLRKLDQLKDSFLANTSHELRTPLNGIIGLAEALADGAFGKLNNDVIYNLNMIAISGKRLSALINDILDFSKLSEDRLVLRKTAVDLYNVTCNVFALLRTLADSKSVRLVNEVPVTLAKVEADENRLQQILINLVGNAIKYTDEGHVKIYARAQEHGVLVAVEDTGTGITTADQEQIFSAFTQLESKDNREYGGTGLGLAITKQLIQLHGGQLHLVSVPGKGSTFSFHLKLASPQLAEHAAAQTSSLPLVVQPAADASPAVARPAHDHQQGEIQLDPTPDAQSFTVLIVDDDPVNRMVLSSILNLHQFRCVEAKSGQEAIDVVESGAPVDLIILDVMMPRMSGFETCMRLRALRPVETLPILFLTAKHFNDDLVRGFVAGGNDFLTKPIAKNELLSRVNTHLRLLQITRKLTISARERTEEVHSAYRQLHWLDELVHLINRSDQKQQLLQDTLDHLETFLHPGISLCYWQYQEQTASFRCCAISRKSPRHFLGLSFHAPWNKTNMLAWSAASQRVITSLRPANSPVEKFECYPRDSVLDVFAVDFEQEFEGLIIQQIDRRAGQDRQSCPESLKRIHAHLTAAVIKSRTLP